MRLIRFTGMWSLALIGVAWAGQPNVYPSVEDVEIKELVLCFMAETETAWRYVTLQDLATWKIDMAGLEKRALESSKAGVAAKSFQVMSVEDTEKTYWMRTEGDLAGSGVFLYPDKLEEITTAPPVVAVPAWGVVLTWVPGDETFDRIMAVGAHRIFNESDHPVSTKVLKWNGERWTVWGEAVRP